LRIPTGGSPVYRGIDRRTPSPQHGLSLAILAILPLMGLAKSASGDQRPAAGTVVEVDGSAFRISKDGRVLPQNEIVGAKLTVKDANGVRLTVRIDQEMLDPNDAAGEVHLYKLSVQDVQSGEWQNMCSPGPGGVAMAFPLRGSWTSDGRHLQDNSFSVTCTAGAIGKCIRYGYKPWSTGPHGEPLWDYHQACTRMVRADYCGDGISWTRDGMPIDVYDRLGIQIPDRSQNMQFEAAWGPDGAVCVSHPRVLEKTSLDQLMKRCPKHVAPIACTDAATAQRDDVLLSNESFAK
jgi:hypothetical protein